MHSVTIKQVLVGSFLVDMYPKCGSLANAQEVSDKLPVQDAVCWTALITQGMLSMVLVKRH